MNKINYYHSLIFFNLSIFLSAFEFLRNNDPLIICLFLILSLGISHGALDNLKGIKLLKIYNYRSTSLFYISYIFAGLSVIVFWLIFPKFILMIFLIVASYHFGKEDSEFIKSSSNFDLIYFLKGCVIVVAPRAFSPKPSFLCLPRVGPNWSGKSSSRPCRTERSFFATVFWTQPRFIRALPVKLPMTRSLKSTPLRWAKSFPTLRLFWTFQLKSAWRGSNTGFPTCLTGWNRKTSNSTVRCAKAIFILPVVCPTGFS